MKPNWVYGLHVCFLICLFRNGTRGAGLNAIIGHSIAVNTSKYPVQIPFNIYCTMK